MDKQPVQRIMLSIQATPDIAGIRTAELYDQEHTVIPTIALVEGVLWPANAPAPELALAEEFGRFPEGWNGRPVVFDHPRIDGLAVSASSPDVLEDNAFGQLFNTVLEDGKLKTEIWINESRLSGLSEEAQAVIENLKNGEGIAEVSTGLFTMSEPVEGEFDGKAYEAIWRNIVPDHLAVLPEGIKGACSVEDGCGAPRANAANEIPASYADGFEPVMRAAQMNPACECEPEDADQKGIFQKLLSMAGGLLKFKNNADSLSDADVRTALNNALNVSDPDRYFFILAVYPGDGKFVYEVGFDGTLFERPFTIGSDGAIDIGADAVAVRPVTTFVPVEVNINDAGDNNSTIQENAMNIEELVNALVANEATQYNEDDREWLSTLEETQLSKMVPVVAEANDDDAEGDDSSAGIVDEGDAAPVTTEDYIADAPPEVQAILNSGVRMHRSRTDALVTALMACSRCTFSEDQLRTKSVDELEGMAALAQDVSYEGAATTLAVASESDDAVPAPIQIFDLNADAA